MPSTDPHPLQSGVHLGFPESDGPSDFEVWEQAGHAPAEEVAFGDLEVGADLFFGEKRIRGVFVARAISWRVHADAGMSTRGWRDYR